MGSEFLSGNQFARQISYVASTGFKWHNPSIIRTDILGSQHRVELSTISHGSAASFLALLCGILLSVGDWG